MKAKIEANGKIKFIQFKNINFPFTERYGFYIGDWDFIHLGFVTARASPCPTFKHNY